jgi:lipoyl(octanoyl) transferase
MICEVWPLGRITYTKALALQAAMVEARGRDESVPDRLLLLEHPHTYTLGTSGKEQNLLMPPDEREQRGVTVLRVDRGGDITYHGPGQLIGYPIMELKAERGELRVNFIGYVRKLEQVIIRTLADYGVQGRLIPGLTGVWVDNPSPPPASPDGNDKPYFSDLKIAAIGVKINVRAITKHGFALNLNTDLSYFDGIIPCGIPDKGVTSLAALLGHPVDEAETARCLVRYFGEVFEREMVMHSSTSN